ncbi:hypothetical protein H5410_003035 [Solanum commersonii]|uniref:DUF4283 domain-containing protein n=1 Tax=Solanum commersonii TaxID=4109 RepID=A0A9J6B3K9_SOLCO|nr:hypothetical protein H5410_003035 [Solanum commersonii]
MQQSKEYVRTQPNSTIKEAAGKSVNFAPNNYDHNFPPFNNSHSSQNVHEKGQLVVQNRAKEQSKNSIQKGPGIDSSIPPPIKVSSNYDTYKPNHQRNNQSSPRQNQNKLSVNSSSTRNVNHQIPNLAPPTVTQSLATRLRANQIKNDTPLDITSPIISTRQGYPYITFHEEDFMFKMPGRCKYTLLGKFTNAIPKMEVIRRSFIAQTQLTGGVRIVHFNSRHIYIDLDNEVDHISVWTKQRMFIAGHLMKLQGHIIGECPMKERDEEIKKRKEEEAVKKGQEKQLNQVPKGNQQHEDSRAKAHSHRQTNTRGPAEEYTMQKEEQWQTQTRRKIKLNSKIRIQISIPPSPIIVEIEQCVANEVPTPVIPSILAEEVVGGRMAVKEKTTNMQEGEPMGRELPHVLHKNQTADLKIDLQAPATTASAVQ